jgi:pyrophosphatase PpaX
MIRTVLFDVDGTLLDSSDFICGGFEHALERYQFPVPNRLDLLSLLRRGLTLEECYRLLTDGTGSMTDLIEVHRSFQETRTALPRPFPGVSDVLPELGRRGYKLAAITTRSRRTSLKTLEAAQLLAHFEAVVSWEDVERPKPHPDPVLLALARLGVASSEAVMVGDTGVDIEAGRRAGTKTIGGTYGLLGAAIAETAPDGVVDALAELLEYLPQRPRFASGTSVPI